MRLFKLLASLVILCLIAIFIYENIEIWKNPVSFKFNLYFNEGRDTAVIQQYIVILVSALAGFLIGLATLLKPYFKTRRQLKRERIEKKQAIDQLPQRQASPESQVEIPVTPVQTDEAAGS